LLLWPRPDFTIVEINMQVHRFETGCATHIPSAIHLMGYDGLRKAGWQD
jgi:hypothetical protein